MTRHRISVRHLLAPLAIASVLLAPVFVPLTAASAAAVPPGGNDAHRFITVMTQNLDEGTDFTPLFTGTTSVPAFLTAASEIFHEVVASNIPARAGLVAGEIAAAAPDAVALQEASLWQWQSATGSGSIDALAALEQALAADGAHYAPALVVDEFSGGAPVPGFGQVTFLDRDVLLVRTDEPPGQFAVTDVQSGHYATVLSIPTVVGTVHGSAGMDFGGSHDPRPHRPIHCDAPGKLLGGRATGPKVVNSSQDQLIPRFPSSSRVTSTPARWPAAAISPPRTSKSSPRASPTPGP